MIIDINSEDQFDEYINSRDILFIDYYATWCKPCKVIKPNIESLSKEYRDIKFLSVNIDKFENIAESNNIRSMPTFHLVKNKKLISEVVGADLHMIKKCLNHSPSVSHHH